MSFTAVRAVMDHSETVGPARLVLLCIARSAHLRTGETYLSMAAIASRAAICERRARAAVRRCEALGELHCTLCAGRSGVNLYRVEISGAVESDPDENGTKGGRNRPDGIVRGADENGIKGGRNRPGGADENGVKGGRYRPPESIRVERESEREDADDESPAAEPHSGRVAAPVDDADASHPEGAAATDADASAQFVGGLPPPLTPFRAHALDAAPWSGAWSRLIRRSHAAAHNGMADEWADLCAEVGCRTWDDAGAAVREYVRQAKQETPGQRKPFTTSQCSGYMDRVQRHMVDRHRAASASHLVEPQAQLIPAGRSKPEPKKPETKAEEAARIAARRQRILSGDLNAGERMQIESNRHVINELGDIVPRNPNPLNLPPGARENLIPGISR